MAQDAPELRPMADAPRDGQLIRLWPREGKAFIGYYSDKWFGWVSYQDPVPLIQGNRAFTGWEPMDQAEALNAPLKKMRRRRGPPRVVRVIR